MKKKKKREGKERNRSVNYLGGTTGLQGKKERKVGERKDRKAAGKSRLGS